MGLASDQLRSLTYASQSATERFARAEMRRLISILERAQREAQRRLAARLDFWRRTGLDRGPVTTARIRVFLAEAQAILERAYREVGIELAQSIVRVAESETARGLRALSRAIPPDIRYDPLPVSEATLERLSRQTRVAGRSLDSYLGSGRGSVVVLEMRKYRNVIREAIETGLLLGDGVEAVVRQIRARGATVARNALRFIVDSAIKEAANEARLATFAANAGPDGVVKGYQWLSTIDLRTTPQWCIPRDLKLYDVNFQPIKHGIPWGAGPGRIHGRCRSTMTAVLKSWRELGLPFREVGRSTRASMDGRVSARRSVIDRLSSSKTRLYELERVFGKQRARLIWDGELSIPDLYDSKGRLLAVAGLVKAA